MSRRVYCVGPGERPCPARAWWYYAGFGRPRTICRVCQAPRRNWRQRVGSPNLLARPVEAM
jgi:hypothetical protein